MATGSQYFDGLLFIQGEPAPRGIPTPGWLALVLKLLLVFGIIVLILNAEVFRAALDILADETAGKATRLHAISIIYAQLTNGAEVSIPPRLRAFQHIAR